MVFQPARRRFRERLPHPGVVVAVAATLATVGTGALLSTDAFAAAAPPPLEMVASVDHQTFTRYEGEGFYPYGLGLFVRAGNSPLEVRTTRDPSYAKPVTASIWTGDVDKAVEIGAQLETGTVFMNRCDYLDPALCWTGVKETGRGAALSYLGYLSVTRPKSYHLRKL